MFVHVKILPLSLPHRFGSGYTLQIKIQPVVAGKTFDQHSIHRTHSRSRSPTPTPPSPSHHKGAAPSNPYDTTEIERFITETFPGAYLLEHHQVFLPLLQVVW